MVRFSCFHGHIHSPRQKRTVQLSTEALQKTVEDISPNPNLKKCSYATMGDLSYQKEEVQFINDSPTERDCRSEEIDSNYNTDSDLDVHEKAQIRKSRSLGSGLDCNDKGSDVDDSKYDVSQRCSHDGSAGQDESHIGGTSDYQGISWPGPCQEPIASDSVQPDSDFEKKRSIFSIGDTEELEKDVPCDEDIPLSGGDGSGNHTPRTPPAIVKSKSLPDMSYPKQISKSLCSRSKSTQDLNALRSKEKGMDVYEGESKLQNQERDFYIPDIEKNGSEKNGSENLTDNGYETCNYVDSAKDWIIPVSDGVNMEKYIGGTSLHQLGELPGKDFRLKRIEDWVVNLQNCGPLEESDELVTADHELPRSNSALEFPAASKLNDKVNPGMEAAKRYISSLSAAATSAHLTNLGLVVIPFLSVFVSLKALNLSGNAIAKITAGSLPRGLHILNLSKNNISTIEGLRDLTRLRVLDLSYNRILRIGHGLASCSSLKELYLAGNKISEVEGLHRLLKLIVLDLRFNKISTTKCLGQLAANYNSLQALSLEGNPVQKNVGDEQLKKYLQSILPHLTYYNRQSTKVVGTSKDTADRSARLVMSTHQTDRGVRGELKTTRKASHGIVAHRSLSLSTNGRKSQAVASSKLSRSRHGRPPPAGAASTSQRHQFRDFGSKLLSFRPDFSIHKSRSEGTLGAL